MGPVGFEPTTNQLCSPLPLSRPLSGLWAGLSLYPRGVPAVESLHLRFPVKRLARDYRIAADVGFPEFDRLYPRDRSRESPMQSILFRVSRAAQPPSELRQIALSRALCR